MFEKENFNYLKNIHDDKVKGVLVLYYENEDDEIEDQVEIELSKVMLLTMLRSIGVQKLQKVGNTVVDLDCYNDEGLIILNNQLLNSNDAFDVSDDVNFSLIDDKLISPEEYMADEEFNHDALKEE